MAERFYTTREAAQKLKISRIAVFKMIKSGRLLAARTRRSYHIPEHALQVALGTSLTQQQATWLMWVAEKLQREFGSAIERIGKE